MELLAQLWDLVVHLDKHLAALLAQYGTWIYALLCLIVFCETGLVVTPFLPGDSLLFVAGALWAAAGMEAHWLALTLISAALLGDNVNHWIGRYLGPRVFRWEGSRIFNKQALDYTREFYKRHGGKTIIIARFMPIIRTFAPFVAGIGSMTYPRFLAYNVIGGLAWIGLFVCGGYFFGNIPVVKRNFTLVIMAIIFISILPGIIEFVRHRMRAPSELKA